MPANDPSHDAIRTAVIGYGLGGRYFHAAIIAVTRGLRLTAIVTGDPERQRQARAEHPAAEIVATAEELFEGGRGDVDLVVISTPNRTHVPLAHQAIDAGCAVVVDKPLAPTSLEARQLIAAARERSTLLTVYQNRRWDGDFLTLRRILREGRLGDVHRFESRFERWRPALKGGWRELGAREEAGGLLFDLGSHLIDQAVCLFGDVSDIRAELDRRRPSAEADDDVFVALKHSSGVRSHLWASVLVAQNGPRFRVLGNRAAFTKFGTDVQEDALRSGRRPNAPDWGVEPQDQWGVLGVGEDLARVPTERGAYQEFYAAIVRSFQEGAPPPVDPNDAVVALEIIEAALRSASPLIEGGGRR